uniref:Sushi domain-containing protein n=1 Tax=Chromera velia CCMP2878 TaxID=1169474 RepID=A0A0G4G4U0_9ALVE|eukprot:Cvel_20221.t1-p1 / transcript=Cvel_20221.t1 / gene=Cvel_20221 / organism=Chromera_velia_CCMP2878 / gene_product=hypothetical protein / transcript_product=hypothetical protein / location=Cvel_scaffold1800:17306-18544(-) / protein_length=147 / sequence_SO=supercontig / SO=protein_coding / is_pseudo=false
MLSRRSPNDVPAVALPPPDLYSCEDGYELTAPGGASYTITGPAYTDTCTATGATQYATWLTERQQPECKPAACVEVNDPEPNALSPNVIRSYSGQSGTTSQTATFPYSCNPGYRISGTADPTLTCTGTGYGTVLPPSGEAKCQRAQA